MRYANGDEDHFFDFPGLPLDTSFFPLDFSFDSEAFLDTFSSTFFSLDLLVMPPFSFSGLEISFFSSSFLGFLYFPYFASWAANFSLYFSDSAAKMSLYFFFPCSPSFSQSALTSGAGIWWFFSLCSARNLKYPLRGFLGGGQSLCVLVIQNVLQNQVTNQVLIVQITALIDSYIVSLILIGLFEKIRILFSVTIYFIERPIILQSRKTTQPTLQNNTRNQSKVMLFVNMVSKQKS